MLNASVDCVVSCLHPSLSVLRILVHNFRSAANHLSEIELLMDLYTVRNFAPIALRLGLRVRFLDVLLFVRRRVPGLY